VWPSFRVPRLPARSASCRAAAIRRSSCGTLRRGAPELLLLLLLQAAVLLLLLLLLLLLDAGTTRALS
jgi:hypothetical protein